MRFLIRDTENCIDVFLPAGSVSAGSFCFCRRAHFAHVLVLSVPEPKKQQSLQPKGERMQTLLQKGGKWDLPVYLCASSAHPVSKRPGQTARGKIS